MEMLAELHVCVQLCGIACSFSFFCHNKSLFDKKKKRKKETRVGNAEVFNLMNRSFQHRTTKMYCSQGCWIHFIVVQECKVDQVEALQITSGKTSLNSAHKAMSSQIFRRLQLFGQISSPDDLDQPQSQLLPIECFSDHSHQWLY